MSASRTAPVTAGSRDVGRDLATMLAQWPRLCAHLSPTLELERGP
jgi:hypothetical protein